MENIYQSLSQVLPLVLVFIVLYFLVLRPQQQKVKAHQEKLSHLKKGDCVVTSGGLIGKINRVETEEIFLEIADGVVVQCKKAQVSEIISDK